MADLNYYDIFETEEVTVAVGNEQRTLKRVGLGIHFYLNWLGLQVGRAPLDERVGYLRRFLRAGGIDDLDALGTEDLVAACQAIRALNQRRGDLAWETLPAPERDERTTDYQGRELAHLVDVLASNYGWSLDVILALPVEVALVQVQECVLRGHRNRRWEHFLSEIAWEYDPADKKKHYKPLPSPQWDMSTMRSKQYKPVSQRIRDKYYPKGVIIDLNKRQNSGA